MSIFGGRADRFSDTRPALRLAGAYRLTLEVRCSHDIHVINPPPT